MRFWEELRYGLRSLAKSPSFTTIAVLTLALGIGANAAVFAVIDEVLLHPLPYPHAERIVGFSSTKTGRFSKVFFRDFSSQSTAFDEIAGYADWPFTVTKPGEPSVVTGVAVDDRFFELLDIRPMLGRLFTEDDARTARPVAVISERMWRHLWNSDQSIVGQTIGIDGRPYAIVGVLPSSLRFPFLPEKPDVWLLLSSRTFTDMLDSISGSLRKSTASKNSGLFVPERLSILNIIARLRPNITLAQAQSEATIIEKRFVSEDLDGSQGFGIRVALLESEIAKNNRKALLLLLAAVGLVLLIACANVANLMLARATTRQRETAIRIALGATRLSIIRQMLIESTGLGVLGGLAGVAISYMLVKTIGHWMPRELAQFLDITINWQMLWFTAAVSVGSGILFGSVPVSQLSGLRIHESLKISARGLSEARGQRQLRYFLVVIEVALAVILVVGSGLLLRTFTQVISVDPGYTPRGVLLAQVHLPFPRYQESDSWRSFATAALEQLRAKPGVEEVAAAVRPPVAQEDVGIATRFEFASNPLSPEARPIAELLPVTPGYFRLLHIPVLRGRSMLETDMQGSMRVCLVDQLLARKEWPGQDVIGQRLDFPSMRQGCEVVGVVGNVIYGSLDLEPSEVVYVPFDQFPFAYVTFLVRTSLPPASTASSTGNAIHAVDPDLAVLPQTMEELLGQTMAEQRFRTLLVGMFATLALLLAAIGISSTLTYSVSRKMTEIGIRMVLGAHPLKVMRQVMVEGLRLIAAGTAIGLVAAFAVARLMQSLMFEISPHDELTYAGAAALLGLVGLVACFLPAQRASRRNPVDVLRNE